MERGFCEGGCQAPRWGPSDQTGPNLGLVEKMLWNLRREKCRIRPDSGGLSGDIEAALLSFTSLSVEYGGGRLTANC